MLTSAICLVYDFQTLLTGFLAVAVAVVAGIPVWRQLRHTNLQTSISHRETLAALLRDALGRYAKVDQSLHEPLTIATRITRDPAGDPIEISAAGAHHLDLLFFGVLDWYLVVLAETEADEVEARKADLKTALANFTSTLNDAHWADHNDQQGDDYDIPDDRWAKIVARCAEAKIEAAERLIELQSAYRALEAAQQTWVRSLRVQIAKLDLQITRAA